MKPRPFDMNDNIATLTRNWACLADLGYKFRGIKQKRLTIDDTCRRFVFVNRPARRVIEISNFYTNDWGLLFVTNLDPAVRPGDSAFELKDWLGYHATDLPEELSKERYLKIKYSSKEMGIELVLEFLERLFLGPLKPILIGEKWENVPWDDTYK